MDSSVGGRDLYLTSANNYLGGTTIVSGTLTINSDAALGPVPEYPAINLTFAGSGTLQWATGGLSVGCEPVDCDRHGQWRRASRHIRQQREFGHGNRRANFRERLGEFH